MAFIEAENLVFSYREGEESVIKNINLSIDTVSYTHLFAGKKRPCHGVKKLLGSFGYRSGARGQKKISRPVTPSHAFDAQPCGAGGRYVRIGIAYVHRAVPVRPQRAERAQQQDVYKRQAVSRTPAPAAATVCPARTVWRYRATSGCGTASGYTAIPVSPARRTAR